MKTLLILLLATPLFGAQIVEDLSGLSFKTPSMAKIETRKIILENRLSAYLVSDPDIEESGVAIAVETGSWQDPREASGMAHFTEHMLFLGNAAYPEENGFRRFLDAHNGKANAFTTDQFTCYMFAIDSGHLSDALDPFAHFFIEPIFSESAMVRERVAVDQEFERAKEHDGWRQQMVQKAIANPRHPHSDFGFGSHETLGSLTTDQMRTWFENHYSSNLMHLIVYSSLPLDTLESFVETSFSQIPNRKIGPFPTPGYATAEENEGKLLVIKPHKDLRNLTLSWEVLYNDHEERKYGTAKAAAYLLGHEGAGSLSARLKGEGLISEMETGIDAYRKPHSPTYTFQISVDLTEKGLQEQDLVVRRIFEAINAYKQEAMPAALFEEMQSTRQIGYEYGTRTDLFSLMRTHAMHLAEEPLATYPRELILAQQFSPGAIKRFFHSLRPKKAHYTLLADPMEAGVKTSQKERYMGAHYTLIPLSQTQLESWEKAPSTAAFPTPNPYVPKELTLVQTPGLKGPIPLSEDAYGTLYYADDTTLSLPKVSWTLAIKSPIAALGSAKSAALLDFIVAGIDHTLAEESFNAQQGGLYYILQPSEEGIKISLTGFREKAFVLFSKLLDTLKDFTLSESDFDMLKESLGRAYGNVAKETPVVQSIEILKSLLIESFVSSADKAAVLRSITQKDLLAFRDQFVKTTYVQGVLFGNFTLQEAKEAAERIRSFQTNPYPEGKTRKVKAALLPEEGPFLVTKKSESRGTAAILTLQETPYSLTDRSLQQILAAALEEPFFTALRTQQQTGYVVWSFAEDIERSLFQSFLVQSSTHDPRDLIARYEAFIESFLRTVKTGAFSKEQFNTLKNSLIVKLNRPSKNPKEVSEKLFANAFEFHDFNWTKKRVEATEPLTYEQFQKCAEEWLGKENKRRLGVLLKGELPQDALEYKALNSPQKWKSLATYRRQPTEPTSNSGG